MAYALVTGAARGIGKAIAWELASKNYDLLLVDIESADLFRTAHELLGRFPIKINTITRDLSEPDAAREILEWSQPWHHDLTVVVNNAGYGLNGAFAQLGLEEQLNIIDLNIKAQVALSYRFIPVLKRHPKAYLLNVGSTTAYQTVPYLNVYAASKAFVLSFTRGLRYELQDSTVSVSCLSPGSTDTHFVVRARMGDSILKTAERFNMTARDVAKIAIRGLFKGKTEIIPGFTNKLNAWLPKFFPKKFVEKIGAGIYKPRETGPENTPVTRAELIDAGLYEA